MVLIYQARSFLAEWKSTRTARADHMDQLPLRRPPPLVYLFRPRQRTILRAAGGLASRGGCIFFGYAPIKPLALPNDRTSFCCRPPEKHGKIARFGVRPLLS